MKSKRDILLVVSVLLTILKLLKFIEEHEDSVWASSFLLAPKERLTAVNNNWISTPSDRHYQGCNISFADGHVEYWKWYSPKAPKDATRLASSGRDFTDIRRLQETLPQ